MISKETNEWHGIDIEEEGSIRDDSGELLNQLEEIRKISSEIEKSLGHINARISAIYMKIVKNKKGGNNEF